MSEVRDETESNAPSLVKSTYLTTCSRVTQDAYNRVLQQLQVLKDGDKKTANELEYINRRQEEREREERERRQKEIVATKELLQMQMELKREQEKREREKTKLDHNTALAEMPDNLVNVFPRIIETPLEIRRARKMQQQEEIKKILKDQMHRKSLSQIEEKLRSKEEENSNWHKMEEDQKKKEEENLQKNKVKLEAYQTELQKDIECRTIQKQNEKKLEDIEYQGVTALTKILNSDPEKNSTGTDVIEELLAKEPTVCFPPEICFLIISLYKKKDTEVTNFL